MKCKENQVIRFGSYLKINFKQLIHQEQHAPLFGVFNASSAVTRDKKQYKGTFREDMILLQGTLCVYL